MSRFRVSGIRMITVFEKFDVNNSSLKSFQSLKPHWEKAATELKGKVKLGAVDATIHRSFAQQYGVQVLFNV